MCIDVSGQLTIFFDCPFWVGVFEVFCDGKVETNRVIFGAGEPKDGDVYQLVLTRYFTLRFSPPTPMDKAVRPKAVNPKRLQRQINQQLATNGISNQSHEVIRRQYESRQMERKRFNRNQKDKAVEEKYRLKQRKKKNKHKGR